MACSAVLRKSCEPGPAVRHERALGPRRAGQRLQRVVDRVAPQVQAVRVRRHDQRRLPGRVGGQEGGRLAPVRGYLAERPRLEYLAGQLRHREPEQDQGGHRRQRRAPRHPARAYRQLAARPAGHRVGGAEGQRDGDHRLDLVQAAQRGQRPVEQLVRRPAQRAAERPPVPGQRHRGSQAHAGHQPAPGRHVPAGQPVEPRAGRDGRGEDRRPRRDLRPARGQPRGAEVHVGGPVPGAAQEGRRRHVPERGGRLLDVRQEVERVPALQQQRDQPPRCPCQHRGGPLGQQRQPALAGRDEDEQGGQHEDVAGGGRVHPAHRGDREPGQRHGPPL